MVMMAVNCIFVKWFINKNVSYLQLWLLLQVPTIWNLQHTASRTLHLLQEYKRNQFFTFEGFITSVGEKAY